MSNNNAPGMTVEEGYKIITEAKYCRVKKDFPHYQVEKWNGTKGNCVLTEGMVGVLRNGIYEFEEVKDPYTGKMVKPTLINGLVCDKTNGLFEIINSSFDFAHDEDDAALKERFEVRLLTAKSHIDLRVAELYYCAGQVDRLAIKETMMRGGYLNNTQTPTT